MIPFDQEFEHLQARMLFGMNKFQITWELGKPMPPDLPDRIVEAMQSQGPISIAPGGPAVTVRLAPFGLGAHLLRLLCAQAEEPPTPVNDGGLGRSLSTPAAQGGASGSRMDRLYRTIADL